MNIHVFQSELSKMNEVQDALAKKFEAYEYYDENYFARCNAEIRHF